MAHVTERFNLPWKHEKPKTAHGRLDERFLAGHDLPVPASLPFLPDLYTEVEKSIFSLRSSFSPRK